MAKRNEIYKCEKCGIIVQVLHESLGTLVCCTGPMTRVKENTTDAAVEKHIPVLEPIEGGYKVKVGSVAHPMTPEHYIEWIELIADGRAYRQYLSPDQPAEAVFMVQATEISVREYCNLHGLWKA